MKSFQGSTLSKLDESGRLKLPPNVVADFKSVDHTGNVVLKYLPEGAIAIRPANAFESTPSSASSENDDYSDPAVRIRLRKASLLINYDTISDQGRLTLPKNLLDRIAVKAGQNVALIGVSNGYEIWHPESLDAEMDKEIAQDRRQYEQKRDQPSE